MSASAADRNLLFGILALQMDFVSRTKLIEAMHAWILRKSTPLGELLVLSGAMSNAHRQLLEPLVDAHIAEHGHDLERSLQAIGSVRSVREELEQLPDPDVQASLRHVSAGDRSYDTYATRGSSSDFSSASGRFRILRPHAKGGLGEVFIANDAELHRLVAVKEILTTLADSQDSRARFVQEAEITGGLEHPGIVPVYGLGHYPDGRPFYAMRFIRGDSLKQAIARFHSSTADAGQRSLELRGLLGRFVDVCNAIEYAHSRGVLHRDLKPGNIMLGKYGETLVVDWGLAKVSGAPLGPAAANEQTLKPSASGSAPTQIGAAVGTPQYMSPEQAAGQLDRLGPRSDVYSLGATFFSLLTGRAPFENLPIDELLSDVQAGRFATPRAVKPDVTPALEAICLKAMAFDPAARYVSPDALARDVERWLADEPVAAFPDSLSGKLGRFGRHHQTAVASLTALMATLVVGLAIGAWLLTREQHRTEEARQQAVDNLEQAIAAKAAAESAERQAELARQTAESAETAARANAAQAKHEARLASDVSEFLKGLFRASDPIGFLSELGFRGVDERASELKAIDILKRGATQIQRLEDDELKAAFLNVLGGVYLSLGSFDRARELIDEGYRIRQRCMAGQPLALADSLHQMGMCALFSGDYDTANEHLRAALALRKQVPDAKLAVAESQFLLGWSLASQTTNGSDEAESLFTEAYKTRLAILGRSHRDVKSAALVLIANLVTRNKILEALPLLDVAIASADGTQQTDKVLEVARTYVQSVIYRKQRKYDDAVKSHREAIEKMEQLLGPDHPLVAAALGDLSGLLFTKGDARAGEDALQRAVQIVEKSLPLSDPRIISGVRDLGAHAERRGDRDTAIHRYRDAWERCRNHYPRQHSLVLSIAEPLTRALRAEGRNDEAAQIDQDTW
jgi:serine/threonine protein kinase/tetratricopeptide (TPR) repeat protein